jgi:hypothetical protein
MKVIIYGAGRWGKRYCNEHDDNTKIVAVADDNKNLQGTTILGHNIISPAKIADYEYEKIIIAMHAESAINEALSQLNNMGISLSRIELVSYYAETSPRVSFLRNFKIENPHLAGDVAECGVHRGYFAHFINKYYPDRKCYLFDSFDGFAESAFKSDEPESALNWLTAANPHFKQIDIEHVKLRMPFKEQIIICKGFVPETFNGLEYEKFAMVSLDMDLYEPQLAALRFFASRMSRGGIILLHDYINETLPGTRRAVDEASLEFSFARIPIGDLCSIGLIFL